MASDEPTMNDWLFIGEYVKDWNATAALRRSGVYVGEFAGSEASRRLNKRAVKKEIEKVRQAAIEKVQLSTSTVIQDIVNVLTADPRDLIDTVTEACRHCYGEGHQYQYTIGEYSTEEFKAMATNKPFNPKGGVGFNPNRDPHPDCPECHGNGIVTERLKDTRFLSPSALALYNGVERTKNGIKINMRSKDAAREAAARWLGMNKETVNVLNGKNLDEASDEDLERIARGEKK